MKKSLLSSFAVILLALCTAFFLNRTARQSTKLFTGIQMPAPVEGEENEELRNKYIELRHRAAPGISWKEIENSNMLQTAALKNSNPTIFNFANGSVNGNWEEKGAGNIAGSIRAVDYLPATNVLYTLSNGGTLWKSVLGSGSWTILNQQIKFEQRTVKVFTKLSGGTRLLLAAGITAYYSDDEGQTLTPSTGISFPVGWGGNYIAGFYQLNDGANTIYCLTRPWSNSPFAPRFRLYRSTDQGQTYTQIIQFDTGDDNALSICNPYNSNQLFVTDVASAAGTVKTYSVTGATVTLINSFAIGGTNTNGKLKGTFVGGIYYMYLMINNNKIYQSTNLGSSWTLQSTFTENAWDKMNVSMSDPSKVSYGGVNAYRSANSGLSFTKVNDWSEYYSNTAAKLHADIMEIEYFKKTDNTEFAIVDCHGGTYVTYDNLVTVSNLSLSTHVAVEDYDVITDTFNLNRMFAGSQDQGLQRTLTANTPGIRDFIQVISGDYGQLSLTNNNNFLWPQYPGGTYYLYNNLGNAGAPSYIGTWSTPGSQKPNAGWMLAATATASVAANEIWIGGGNLTGAGGSYLIKATLPTAPPYNVSATQFSYDFRANSNSTTAGISAIEQSLVNPNKLFVAAEDGSFFYSSNLGANWTKTAAFSGPGTWYLYGSCILASKLNENVLWYCGSGYSNPGVYKSVNAGASFTAMANGLPATLVNEIVATPDEKYIFAATEAGPYVYVVADNLWYSLADNTVPIQFFTGVEYLRASNTVRFATMGRGIWDFKITSLLPITLSDWQAQKQGQSVLCSWKTEQEINTAYFTVERSPDAIQFNEIAKQPASGNSSSVKQYISIDNAPLAGINYYRLKTTDINGSKSYSNIIAVKFDGLSKVLAVYPNPASNIVFVEVNSDRKDDVAMQLTDMSGKVIWKDKRTIKGHLAFSIPVNSLAKGTYLLLLNGAVLHEVKKIIKQ